jgi:hypothetical protein
MVGGAHERRVGFAKNSLSETAPLALTAMDIESR